MSARAKLIGLRFGRLTVVAFEKVDVWRQLCWLCRCDCGNAVVITGRNLRDGLSQSCGCWKREKATRHGFHGTPEYRSWRAMIHRCTRPDDVGFKYYGGRGITICSRWLQIENFFADMGRKPSPDHSLDRYPDPNGNYEPGNCRWATRVEQRHNRRDSKRAA